MIKIEPHTQNKNLQNSIPNQTNNNKLLQEALRLSAIKA